MAPRCLTRQDVIVRPTANEGGYEVVLRAEDGRQIGYGHLHITRYNLRRVYVSRRWLAWRVRPGNRLPNRLVKLPPAQSRGDAVQAIIDAENTARGCPH